MISKEYKYTYCVELKTNVPCDLDFPGAFLQERFQEVMYSNIFKMSIPPSSTFLHQTDYGMTGIRGFSV